MRKVTSFNRSRNCEVYSGCSIMPCQSQLLTQFNTNDVIGKKILELIRSEHSFLYNRPRFELWLRTSWQGAKKPELAILKYEIILSFQSIWLILGKYDHLCFWVTGILAPTFLVKVVTHKLYFSGVTAFSSLSADLRSRLKPPSGQITDLSENS